MIEINAQPMRLDLDWIHCKRAKALGVTLVINPDAHSTEELELFTYGVDVARRGWLEKDDIFNTRTVSQVEAHFRDNRLRLSDLQKDKGRHFRAGPNVKSVLTCRQEGGPLGDRSAGGRRGGKWLLNETAILSRKSDSHILP